MTTVAGHTFFFLTEYKQMIHVKCQVIFYEKKNEKKKKKKNRMSATNFWCFNP